MERGIVLQGPEIYDDIYLEGTAEREREKQREKVWTARSTLSFFPRLAKQLKSSMDSKKQKQTNVVETS